METNLFLNAALRIKANQAAPRARIYSPLHEFVAKARKQFGETAKKGKGSFGFYLGLLKPLPVSVLYLWLADINDSPNLSSPESKRKVFWWRYAENRKASRE